MARKKWEKQETLTESLIRIRERRKWQVGFRRYVLEKAPAESYAPYFGLDWEKMRHWIEIQFTSGQTWENFGKAWQFEHVLPVAFFDFSRESDLKLCWHFINIRVSSIQEEELSPGTLSILTARRYFHTLYEQTRYPICGLMLNKIAELEAAYGLVPEALVLFLQENADALEKTARLTSAEFLRLNQGQTAAGLLLEREILRKFGAGGTA
ncbi:MAG TPA: hypothetical protein VG890_14375 [Puia sp.]|nr:hypothetical protein [Puia sp.]